MQLFTEIHKPMNVQRSENNVNKYDSVLSEEHKNSKSEGITKKYDKIPKDVDTRELSKPKISDALLSGYSGARLYKKDRASIWKDL